MSRLSPYTDADMKSVQALAQEVLGALDACNLSGVVHSFAHACTCLRHHYSNLGTEFINTHPICILYSVKIAGLTGREDLSSEALDRFSVAYAAVKQLARGTGRWTCAFPARHTTDSYIPCQDCAPVKLNTEEA